MRSLVCDPMIWAHPRDVGWLCWGLTSQSTIFQSYRDGATASWVINQYFRGVKCLAQGHNTAAVGFEPPTSRSGVRHSTTEPPRSPPKDVIQYARSSYHWNNMFIIYLFPILILVNITFDITFRWAQRPFCWFCHEVAQITINQMCETGI